jgi:hypothetical protein
MLRKVVAVLLALVMLGSVVSPAVAASNKQTECRSCNSCSNLENKNVAVFELKGLEKNRLIEKAMKNEKVQKLMDELDGKGFNRKDTRAYEIPVKAKDGSTSHVLVVEMTFKSEKGDERSLIYAYNPNTGESIVILGLWSCAVCAAVIIGGGIGCTGVCVVGGALTFGAACVACIVSAAVVALCPCYDCCCATTGNDACCNSYQNLCT